MSKSKEIHTTNDLVKKILMEDKRARNSDIYLYIKVCETINPEALKQPFMEVHTHLKDYGIPPIETVGRCRRKITRAFPELAGNNAVEEQRMLNEDAFREYARQVNV